MFRRAAWRRQDAYASMSRRLSRPAVKIFLLLVFIQFGADWTTENPFGF
jgi:hypothetical protein